jgi:hypothetical protein
MEAQLPRSGSGGPRSGGSGLDLASVGSIQGGGGLDPAAAALDQAAAGPPRFGSDGLPRSRGSPFSLAALPPSPRPCCSLLPLSLTGTNCRGRLGEGMRVVAGRPLLLSARDRLSSAHTVDLKVTMRVAAVDSLMAHSGIGDVGHQV